jgi:hypothetical protein
MANYPGRLMFVGRKVIIEPVGRKNKFYLCSFTGASGINTGMISG